MTDPIDTFTDTQRVTFQELRARYAEGRDCFTEREVAHLEFIRWLRETGVLPAHPENCDAAAADPIPEERKHAKKSSGTRTRSRHN